MRQGTEMVASKCSIFVPELASCRLGKIMSGAAKLLKELPDGRHRIAGFLLTGDFFGLPADDAYPYSVEAIAETQLCRLRLDRFSAVLSRLPALEAALLDRLIRDLTAAQEHPVLALLSLSVTASTVQGQREFRANEKL